MVGPHGGFSWWVLLNRYGGSPSWWVLMVGPHGGSFSIDMVGHSHEHKYRYGGSLS